MKERTSREENREEKPEGNRQDPCILVVEVLGRGWGAPAENKRVKK